MHLLTAIVSVTLLIDGRTAVLEHLRVRDRCLLTSEEANQRPDVVGLDEVFALRQTHHMYIVNIHACDFVCFNQKLIENLL